MQGYSPKLPLMYDNTEQGVYSLNKTIADSIRQNLKMLLLTSPGERIMDSNFGVGIRNYLFEQDVEKLRDDLSTRITSQVSKYLRFIVLEEINLSPPNSNEEQALYINIKYRIPALNTIDELNVRS